VVAEGDILVTSWRGPDFVRACDTLMAANGAQTPGAGRSQGLSTLLATANALGLLLVGALVTMVTGGLKDAGTRRRVNGGKLRTAAESFSSVFEAHLDAKVGKGATAPGQQDIRNRRQELASSLRAVRAMHRGAPDPAKALRRLRDELGESALRGWELRDDQEKTAEVTTLRATMAELDKDIDAVTTWLERSALSRLGGGT
jgi:hypothetical protein